MNAREKPILRWLQITAGIALCILAYNSFLIPNEIAPGGFTGIGQLVSPLIGWPVGLIALTLKMYALISAFFMSKLLDGVLEGLSAAKAYFIIFTKPERIARRILEEMQRGVTGIERQGMFSGEDTTVLLCVVKRFETVRLRTIVTQTDNRAFIVATDVREALGNDFKPHS